MRKRIPKYGELKTVSKFLWFPKTLSIMTEKIDGEKIDYEYTGQKERRWLEHVTILQEWSSSGYAIIIAGWGDVCFVEKEGYGQEQTET